MITNILAAICTAYCPCASICCGPNAIGLAANGKAPIQGITIAASRKYPLGTKVMLSIPGLYTNKPFVIHDRLAKKYDKRVDVFFNKHEDAVKFGKRNGTLTIVTK